MICDMMYTLLVVRTPPKTNNSITLGKAQTQNNDCTSRFPYFKSIFLAMWCHESAFCAFVDYRRGKREKMRNDLSAGAQKHLVLYETILNFENSLVDLVRVDNNGVPSSHSFDDMCAILMPFSSSYCAPPAFLPHSPRNFSSKGSFSDTVIFLLIPLYP